MFLKNFNLSADTSEHGGKQVSEPSDKAFPRCPFLVNLFRHYRTVLLVGTEYLSQLGRDRQVEYKCVDFVVISQAPAVQVGTSHRTESFVYHHDLRMMKSSVIDIDMCSFFSEAVGKIKSGIGCETDVRFAGNHDFYPDSTVDSLFDGMAYAGSRSKGLMICIFRSAALMAAM